MRQSSKTFGSMRPVCLCGCEWRERWKIEKRNHVKFKSFYWQLFFLFAFLFSHSDIDKNRNRLMWSLSCQRRSFQFLSHFISIFLFFILSFSCFRIDFKLLAHRNGLKHNFFSSFSHFFFLVVTKRTGIYKCTHPKRSESSLCCCFYAMNNLKRKNTFSSSRPSFAHSLSSFSWYYFRALLLLLLFLSLMMLTMKCHSQTNVRERLCTWKKSKWNIVLFLIHFILYFECWRHSHFSFQFIAFVVQIKMNKNRFWRFWFCIVEISGICSLSRLAGSRRVAIVAICMKIIGLCLFD